MNLILADKHSPKTFRELSVLDWFKTLWTILTQQNTFLYNSIKASFNLVPWASVAFPQKTSRWCGSSRAGTQMALRTRLGLLFFIKHRNSFERVISTYCHWLINMTGRHLHLRRLSFYLQLQSMDESFLYLCACWSKTVAEVQKLMIPLHQPNKNEARK